MTQRRPLRQSLLLVVLASILVIGRASLAQDAVEAKEDDAGSDTMTIEFSKTIKLDMHMGGCQANLQIEYWQKGDIAEVNSTLTNPDCGASSGDYTISVRYRDDDGEMTTDEYQETWEREDPEPIATTKQYEIGDNVDLIRVRSRKLSCACTDRQTDQDQ